MKTRDRKGEVLQSPGPRWVSVRMTVMPFPGPVHCSGELGMKSEWSGAEKGVGGGKVF